MNKQFFTPKKIIYIFAVIIFFVASAFAAIHYYKKYLVDRSLNNFKVTGSFQNGLLKRAGNLGSDYATALLMLSYWNDKDTSKAEYISEELTNSSDWRVIALKNLIFRQNDRVGKVSLAMDDEVENGDWFWTHIKGVCIQNGLNGYKENTSDFLAYEKRAADMGCVSAMNKYASGTSDKGEKCKYYKKIIDYNENYALISEVYYKMALLLIMDDGCGIDSSLFFKCGTKSAELGFSGGYFVLGNAYALGIGVPVSFEKAFKNYSRAVELKFDEMPNTLGAGNWMLANCYKNGSGVAANNEKYKEHLDIAAALGCSDAQKEKEQLQQKEREQLQQRNSNDGRRVCECCGNSYNPEYGWGYRDGPFRNGKGNFGAQLMYSLLGGRGSGYVGIKFCSQKCAWECG